MKTKVIRAKDIVRSWHIVDVNNQVLGRVATTIAQKLIGKHKPTYTPGLDCGDYVVVVNASKVKVTGKKLTDKIYRHHTGFPGGFREKSLREVLSLDPAKVVRQSVTGMLPKNKLRDKRLKRLKIFIDANHPYRDKFNHSNTI